VSFIGVSVLFLWYLKVENNCNILLLLECHMNKPYKKVFDLSKLIQQLHTNEMVCNYTRR
jgi:hypothetical protein